MRIDPEAFKHGKSAEEIEFVFASYVTEWFEIGLSERGNERAMLVGFDSDGNAMEIGVELIPSDDGDDEVYFFHAMKATPEWKKKYSERRKHG